MMKWLRLGGSLLLSLLVLLAGCSVGDAVPDIEEAIYEPLDATGIRPVEKARQNRHDQLQQGPPGRFYVVQSGLSPGTLIHGPGDDLILFGADGRSGKGGPSHVAHAAVGGPRIVSRGELLSPREFTECWLLVWYAESRGWEEWDSPWLVSLQRRPVRVRLDEAGLRLSFQGPAGYVFLMPLYGSAALPKEELGPPNTETGLSASVRTWEWPLAIPRDALLRVRYWASASREFPLYCEESFSVNQRMDRLVLRRRYEWLSVEDDWDTARLKVAPVEPGLANCLQSGRLPVTLSKRAVDLDMPTPSGPMLGVERVDEYSASLELLGLVNATGSLTANTVRVDEALTGIQRKLNATVDEWLADRGHSFGKIEPGEFTGEMLTNVLLLTQSLPFLEPALRSNAMDRVGESLRKETSDGTGTGIQTAVTEVFPHWPEVLWTWSHQTGGGGLDRAQWSEIAAGVTGGRTGEEALDAAGRFVFLARLAYQAGDLDRYYYACYLAVKAMIDGHAARVHDDATRTRESDLPFGQADTAGEKRLLNRYWSADVARVWRASAETTKPGTWEVAGKAGELGLLRWQYMFSRDLLDAATVEGNGDLIQGEPLDVIATCLAVLGRGQGGRTQRLVPGSDSSPFVIGWERELVDPKSGLVVNVEKSEGANGMEAPVLMWRTERAGEQSMGSVVVPGLTGARPEREVLNWNTALLAAELAAGDVSDPE